LHPFIQQLIEYGEWDKFSDFTKRSMLLNCYPWVLGAVQEVKKFLKSPEELKKATEFLNKKIST
jgi:hypothetical protein